jgi:hypothetical protein
MSNTNKPFFVAVPLTIANWPWWTNLLLALFAYYLFQYLAEPPQLMTPSGGESAASSIKSFNQKEIWTKACTFGMYALPALFIVAALIGIARTVAQIARRP